MGDNLPELLYTEWRNKHDDPTALPSWGNADASTRAVWDAVAVVSRGYVEGAVSRLFSESYAEESLGNTLAVAALQFAARRLRDTADR